MAADKLLLSSTATTSSQVVRRKRSTSAEDEHEQDALSSFISRSLSCMFTDKIVPFSKLESKSNSCKNEQRYKKQQGEYQQLEDDEDKKEVKRQGSFKKRRLTSDSSPPSLCSAASASSMSSHTSWRQQHQQQQSPSSTSAIAAYMMNPPLPTTISMQSCNSHSLNSTTSSGLLSQYNKHKSRSIGKLSQKDSLYSLVGDVDYNHSQYPASVASTVVSDSSIASTNSLVISFDKSHMVYRQNSSSRDDGDSLSYSDDSAISDDDDEEEDDFDCYGWNTQHQHSERSGVSGYYTAAAEVPAASLDENEDNDEEAIFF